MASIARLVAFFISCIAAYGAEDGAVEYLALNAAVQVRVGEGLDVERIAQEARAAGVDAVVFTEPDVRRVDYGPPFLRSLLRSSYQEHSLYSSNGTAQYLQNVERAQQRFPQMVLVEGVESRPFYYWASGGDGPWALEQWNRRIAAVGLSDAEAYGGLPVSGGAGIGVWNLSSVLLLWPLLGLAYAVVARAHPLALRLVIGAASLLCLVENVPFTVPLWDPYKGDLGPAPYQHYIDRVNEGGGLALWLPVDEALSQRRIALFFGQLTAFVPPAEMGDELLKTRGATAFAALHSGRASAADLGRSWDKVLIEYLNGERRQPLWALGCVDYDSGAQLDSILTVFGVRQASRAGLFEAMRQGRMYAVSGGALRLQLEDFRAESADRSAGAGETLVGAGSVEVIARLSSQNGAVQQVRAQLIRAGKIVREVRGTTPLEMRYVEEVEGGKPVKTYFRLMAQSGDSRLVSNPIFARVEGL